MTAVSPLSPSCWHLPSPGGGADFPCIVILLCHLYQDTDMAILLMAEEKEDPNENPPTPLELGRYQQCGDKVETAVILFIVFAVGICLNRQGLRWGIKHGLYICFVPGPCLCSLVRSIFLLS